MRDQRVIDAYLGEAWRVILEARGLDALDDYQVLWNAHLDVGDGEIVALLGPTAPASPRS